MSAAYPCCDKYNLTPTVVCNILSLPHVWLIHVVTGQRIQGANLYIFRVSPRLKLHTRKTTLMQGYFHVSSVVVSAFPCVLSQSVYYFRAGSSNFLSSLLKLFYKIVLGKITSFFTTLASYVVNLYVRIQI